VGGERCGDEGAFRPLFSTRFRSGALTVPRRSAVNLDSVESVSIATLVECLGRLSGARMSEICRALAVAIDS
jgi:mRNA interferase MazF